LPGSFKFVRKNFLLLMLMVPSYLSGAIPLAFRLDRVCIVEANNPPVVLVMKSQAIADSLRNLLARLDPVGLEFCPTPIFHRENFAVQVQQGFKVKSTQVIALFSLLSCDDKNIGSPRLLQGFISSIVTMGMRVGYARVSSVGQKLDVQLEKLADCDRVYHEKISAGSTKLRLELQKALDFVRDEDVFVVTKLDRLARSVIDLSMIVQRLEEKKVDLVVLDQGIDTTTIYGRLQFNILASIGEFERGLIGERSREGREKAMARGVKFSASAPT
jgi:predicted site-specific integrase-resolvase